jgi:hypothetical protein
MSVSLLTFIRLFIFLAFAWFVFRLARQPGDRALRAIVTCLTLQLLSAPNLVAVLRSLLDGFPSPSITKLATNLLLMISWYCLMLFFLFSAGGSGRRARGEAAVLAVVLIGMASAMLFTPAGIRDRAYPTSGALAANLQIHGVAAFYIIGSVYLGYAAAQTALWALRYAAESTKRTRVGLRVGTAGLVCLAAAASIRGVIVLIRWSGGTFPNAVAAPIDDLVPLGEIVFIVGVSFIGLTTRLAALRVWWRHRRLYHDLRPLWAQLNAVFPEDELASHGRTTREPADRRRDWLFPKRVHRRLQRCWVEIRDGLVQLSPHMRQAGYDPAQPAHEQPEVFHEALAREHTGHLPYSRAAVLVAPSTGTDLQADVRPLVSLAQATAVTERKAVATPSKTDHRDRNARIVDELRVSEPQPYTEGAYVLRALSTPGRVTGQPRAWPIAITQVQGRRFICAPNRTRDWVQNLLAAGQCEVEQDPHPRHHAVLIENDHAASVVSVYLRALGRPSPLWPFPYDADPEEIRRHTGEIAVFRLDPVSA